MLLPKLWERSHWLRFVVILGLVLGICAVGRQVQAQRQMQRQFNRLARYAYAHGWTRTAPPADYTVTTSGGALVVTDTVGNSDTLNVSEGASGSLNFSVPGRTFSVDGATAQNDSSGDIALTGINSITLNLADGNDTANFNGFTMSLPSLTVNGGTGDDTVYFAQELNFLDGANLDLDLQNDDANPGADRVQINGGGVYLYGTGTATIKVSRNVLINNSGWLGVTNGDLVIEANQQATPLSGNFSAVSIQGIDTTFTTSYSGVFSGGTGNVTVKGRGGAAASNNCRGVYLNNHASISGGTTGTLSVTGISGDCTASNGAQGIHANLDSGIDSAGANISIQGTSESTGAGMNGVYLDKGSYIDAGNLGTVEVVGLSGIGAGNYSEGVAVYDESYIGSDLGGDVTVTGTGRSSGDYSVGVEAYAGGITASGKLTVTGTGGSGTNALGVWVDYGAAALYAKGDLTVTATGNNGAKDLVLEMESSYIQTLNAPIVINADSVEIESSTTIDAQASSVTMRPRTPGTAIDLGTDDSAGTLGFRADELSQLLGADLILGRTNSGALTVSNAFTRSTATNIQLIAGGAINLNAAIDSAGGNVTFNSPAGLKPNVAGVDIEASTGTVNFAAGANLSVVINGTTVDTDYAQLNLNGLVYVTGATLTVTGTHTPQIGQRFVIVNHDGVDFMGGEFTGLPQGASIYNFLGSALAAQISYFGGSGNDVELTVYRPNTAPTISTASYSPLSRQQGTTGTNLNIASVNDGETAAGSLSVQVNSAASATVNGVTVSNLTNVSGVIRANVVASCSASDASFTLTVSDPEGLTATATLAVNVSANDTPTVGNYANTPVTLGGATTVTPSASPADSGTVIVIAGASAGFTGSLMANNSTGAVTISNAAPVGSYTITVTVTDSCNVATQKTFTLTVSCPTTLTVNDLGDETDASPGNGVCGTSQNECTLRAALQEANALHSCGGTITINFSIGGTIQFGSSLPILNYDLVIQGPGAAALTLSGGNSVHPFSINSRVNVTFNDLTISQCNWEGGTFTGGAVAYSFLGNLTFNRCVLTNNRADIAGVIFNEGGDLTLNDCTFSNNVTSGPGGVLYNRGPATVLNSTFSNNQGDSGGALLNDGAAITVANCTFMENVGSLGGGFYQKGGTATLVNTTFVGNSASVGGGIYRENGTVLLRNSLLFNNSASTGPNGYGSFASLGHNLIAATQDMTLTGDSTGNLLNVNPWLATQALYGGPTETFAVLPGSPVLDAGNNCVLTDSCASDNLGFNLTTDQRGRNRQTGSAVDIGAFESGGFALAYNSGNNQTTPISSAFGGPLSVTVSALGASEPVNGGRVTFTPPVSGATCTLATTLATISGGVASTGTATANAIAGGPYDVVASTRGAAPLNFSLTNSNTAPTLMANSLTRTAGTSTANFTLASVNDSEQTPGSLAVAITSANPSNGVTLSNLINTNGTVTADVSVACGATSANFTLQVTDNNGLMTTATYSVTVTANANPTIGTYADTTLAPSGGTTVTPTAAPADDTSVQSVTATASAGFTGNLVTNPTTGAVTISGASPAGMYTITVTVTDNCNATTQQTFMLIVNTAPTITATTGLSAAQGSSGTGVGVATVGDADGNPGGLTLQVNGGSSATVGGVTVSNLVNTNGAVTASIVTSCGASTATPASFTLTVTDNKGATATATLNFTVTANTNPTVGTYADATVLPSGGTTVTPSAAPTDNGSVTVTAQASAGFTGSLTPNNATGAVTISNAGPAGMYTVTVTVTDNCNATAQQTFMLVVNTPPTINALSPSAQRGSPLSRQTIATVGDADGNADGLTVQVNGGASATVNGVTISNLLNTSGTISADVVADCGVLASASFTLAVTDNKGATVTTTLTVQTPTNTSPTVGAYLNSSSTVNGSINVTPDAAPADNGTVVSVTATASAGFTGNLSGDATSGVITVTNASPAGVYTITVTVADNCGATFEKVFVLTVNNAPTISPSNFTLQQGNLSANRTIANVNDTDQAPETLVVTVNSGSSATVNGVSLSNLSVSQTGVVTADVIAGCSASTANFMLDVTDNRGVGVGVSLSVTVTANTNPTVGSYADTTVLPSAATTVTPNAAPADNGSVTVTAQASAGFTGSLTPNNATGAVTISNAGPAGTYTITVTVTDNCNATAQRTFTLVVNTPPTITATTGLSFQQGSPSTNVTIATVDDAEGNRGALTVYVQGGVAATLGNLSVSNLVNTNGTITADVVAACNADAALPIIFELTVVDDKSAAVPTLLTVTATTNANPTVGTYAATTILPSGGATVTPSAAPADNGSIASVTAAASAGFTGNLLTNPTTGAVTISNAGPAGTYTVTVTVTDNCNATAQQTFALVVNTPPTISATTGLTRQQGSPSANATIATVDDAEGNRGALSLQVDGNATATVGGVTVSNLVNTNGMITADVVAGCGASTATPASFTLTVTDDKGATMTATLNVTVTANANPTVGTYSDTTLLPGTGTVLTSSSAPADNGSVVSVTATAPNFTGSFSGDPTTGAVTITNAGPPGIYAVTVTVTDNCNATTQRTLTLTVNTPPTINGTTVSVTQASPAASLTIANANDADQPEELLTVLITPLTGTGVTVGSATVNAVGQVSAAVQATCLATNSTFQVKVTDAQNAMMTATLTVNVSNNTPPQSGNYGEQFSTVNGTITALPDVAPTDNGTVASVTATASPASFSGSFSGNATTGALLITNAAPAGVYSVTVTVTDDCGATVQKSFTLTVNNPPQLTTTPLTQQQGSPLRNVNLATVSDTDQAPETLTLTVYDPALRRQNQSATLNGVTLANLAISAAGAVTADVVADCKATAAEFTLMVRDASNATTTATLNVTVPANTPPTLSYSPQMTLQSGNLVVAPTTGLSDNGSIAALRVETVTPAFAGMLAVHPTTGVVTLTNAGPVGSYRIEIVATDNCGATTTGVILLTVECPTITVSPTSLPLATAQTAYQQAFSASGVFAGAAVYSLASGSLPNGLTLASNGVLSGVPTQTGSFTFAVKATDTMGCLGVTPPLTLAVNCPTLALNPPSLPGGQVGVVYQQTLTGSGGTAPYSFSLANGASLPAGLTLAANGLLRGTPTTPGTAAFAVNVTDANGCVGQASYSFAVQCPVLSTLPATLPNPVAGAAYRQPLSGNGGVGPYTCALANGSSLPPGMTLSGDVLSGMPTTPGVYSFAVDITDMGLSAANCAGRSHYTVTVGCPTLTLTPATLPNGAQGAAYNQILTAAPAGTTYSYSVTNGILPPGLSLDAASGLLSGTPTAAGNYSFAITVSGWGACAQTQSYNLLITATCPLITLTPATLPSAVLGTAYNQTLAASGGSSPYSFAVTAGSLPSGVSLSSSGVFSGTPTAAGTFSFTVTATGAGGCAGSQSYSVAVTCPSLTLNPATLPNAAAGTAYSQLFAASPAGTYNYSVAGGSLPPGLTLNAATGELSGTVPTPGSFNFSVKAERSGCSVTNAYTLVVDCPSVTLNPASLPAGEVGTPYSQTLSAAPSGNYSFAVTEGALPNGLTLSPAGLLSGTPTVLGSFNFTIKATGAGNCAGTRSYTLSVTANCATVTLPALPTFGSVGAAYFGNLAGTLPSGSYTFSVESGALPPGLALDHLFSALSGTPTTPGAFNFTLKATAANGCVGTQSYVVNINNGAAARAQLADYDGDGKADPALWRATTGTWDIYGSAQARQQAYTWGGPGDQALLGDYDGDGKADLAVFRPSDGNWYIRRSSDGSYLVKAWGGASDVPTPGDYDGDGKTDIAVFRPSDGNWYVWRSSDQQAQVTAWGSGVAPHLDVPVPGDYDGDGKTDLAVFRRSTGTWFIQRSRDGQALVQIWGQGTDIPVAADYDGDGKTDIAVWRGSTWFIWQSASASYRLAEWGASGAPYFDQAAPGDYDGDGKADLAVWRGNGTMWYQWLSGSSGNPALQTVQHGQTGDRPVR